MSVEIIQGDDVLDRIQNYLGNGGLFNPEMMEHDKVLDLILDCREVISRQVKKLDQGRGSDGSRGHEKWV